MNIVSISHYMNCMLLGDFLHIRLLIPANSEILSLGCLEMSAGIVCKYFFHQMSLKND